MSAPIERLRRWAGYRMGTADSEPVFPMTEPVTMGDLREILRLAELGQKVRDMECEPKDDMHAEALAHEVTRLRSQLADSENNESMHQGRADAFLEALRLIVGVKS